MSKKKRSNPKHAITSADTTGWPIDRPEYRSLSAAVQGEASRWNAPGIAVGVFHNRELVTASAGFANLQTRVAVTDDTIFQIGSITKVFTATLVMMLVEEGLLDLDIPVTAYLPDIALASDQTRDSITVRHLLSHTSGIEGDRFTGYGRGEDALARAIADFDTLRQWFVPGDLWSYSNAGYYLTCRIVEAVTGEVFEDSFRRRLVDPLSLKTCFFFAEDVITRPHAVGHYLRDRAEGPQVAHGYSFPRHINGTGGVVTSVKELLRFAQLHMGNGKIDSTRLLSSKLTKAMREPISEAGGLHRHYGLGWCVYDYPEYRIIGHGGATLGFRANLTAIPDKDFAIVILTNGDAGGRAIQEIEEWALQHYLQFNRPVPAPEPISAERLATFAGRYARHDGEYTVSVGDNRLDFRMVTLNEETGAIEEDHTYPLIAVGERRFRVPDGPNKGAIVDFITYEGYGNPQELVRIGGRLAERISTEDAVKKGNPKHSRKSERK